MTQTQPNISVSIEDLSLNYGAVSVLKNLDIEIFDGEFLVLLGSSGCGKSSLLNCIAGLTEVSDGQIYINGENVTWLEPSDRGIGMVFQSYALYPQMSVEKNLSFGLRNAGTPKSEITKKIANAAKILQIESLMDRKPAQLSGGQRQRVAIGRALVRDVDVFLFDEPLSNLDAKLRASLRIEIKRLHQKLTNTMIYVTHDQVEAMTLADRIAIMRAGKVEQIGTPDEVYNRPNNLYVADFIGSPSMNLIEGEFEDGKFISRNIEILLDAYEFSNPVESKTSAILGIRPEHILTGLMAKDSPIKFDLKVDLVESMGSDNLVWTQLANTSFCIRVDGQTKINTDDTITVGFNLNMVSLFDKESEQRI